MEIDEEADAGDKVVPLRDAAGKIDIVVDDDDVRREQGDESGQRDEIGREPAREPLGRDVYSGAGRAGVSGRVSNPVARLEQGSCSRSHARGGLYICMTAIARQIPANQPRMHVQFQTGWCKSSKMV